MVGVVGAAPASAVDVNPDRDALPIIAGTRIQAPGGYCTVGAVLVPKSIFSRITPYQRATRYIVTAKHCAPLYASIHMGRMAIGSVVWQSAASDIEMIRVSPQPDNNALICAAHHSAPAFCSPVQTYTPRARGQVFMLAAGHVTRQAVTGSGDPEGRFCTSGYATGVKCNFHPASLPPGRSANYAHQVAGEADEHEAFAPGDSGGPVVDYGKKLLGIISGHTPNNFYMLYTPMSQVLHELFSYELAPA